MASVEGPEPVPSSPPSAAFPARNHLPWLHEEHAAGGVACGDEGSRSRTGCQGGSQQGASVTQLASAQLPPVLAGP